MQLKLPNLKDANVVHRQNFHRHREISLWSLTNEQITRQIIQRDRRTRKTFVVFKNETEYKQALLFILHGIQAKARTNKSNAMDSAWEKFQHYYSNPEFD